MLCTLSEKGRLMPMTEGSPRIASPRTPASRALRSVCFIPISWSFSLTHSLVTLDSPALGRLRLLLTISQPQRPPQGCRDRTYPPPTSQLLQLEPALQACLSRP